MTKMAVYVDDMRAPFRGMLMCHMIADTTVELLEMASIIGMEHRWLQRPGSAREHFDVPAPRRLIAIRNGALQITWRQCASMTALRAVGLEMSDPETAEARFRAHYRAMMTS